MCKTFGVLLLSVAVFMSSAQADDAQTCDDKTIKAVVAWAGVEEKLKPTSQDEEADDVESEADDVESEADDVESEADDNLEPEPDDRIAAAACKAMPNAPGTTIAAIAFDTGLGDEYESSNGYKYRMREILEVLALVEAGKVVAAHRSNNQEDATERYGSLSYRIDTARYILSKDVRAFGVVFNTAANPPGAADGWSDNRLTLWIREGKNLRAVFSTDLFYLRGIESTVRRCETPSSKIASADMTISVEKTSSHGFADLAITAHIVKNVCDEDGDASKAGKHTVRKVVKYNGQSYPDPDYDGDWWSSSLY